MGKDKDKKKDKEKKDKKDKDHKKDKHKRSTCQTFLLLVLSVVMPWVAVAIVKGCRIQILYAMLLTVCLILPGIVYAWHTVLSNS